MGYEKVTDFQDKDAPQTDWEPYLDNGKKNTVMLDFRNPFKIRIPTSLIYIREKDRQDGWQEFTELRLSALTHTGDDLKLNHPKYFILRLNLYCEKKQIGSWYVPLQSNCNYMLYDFGMEHLMTDDYVYFDEIEFESLQTCKVTAYLGDMWILQRKVEHNVSIAFTDKFHKKMNKYITTTAEHSHPDSHELKLTSLANIRQGTPIRIGDELHIVKNTPIESVNKVTFTEIYNGETLRFAYSGNTPVYLCIPAWYKDLAQVDVTFPCFYIKTMLPEGSYEHSIMTTRKDSYRVIGEQVQVALRKSIDVVKIMVEIHIIAYNDDLASEMYFFFRSLIDDQGFIDICGESTEYQIEDFQQIDSDPDTDGTEPHSVITLAVFVRDNVHARKYLNFPAIKSISIDVESTTDISDI